MCTCQIRESSYETNDKLFSTDINVHRITSVFISLPFIYFFPHRREKSLIFYSLGVSFCVSIFLIHFLLLSSMEFHLCHWVRDTNQRFMRTGQQDAIHITAILGESVIFNCHVEFPGDHPVPYVLQWEKKVSETVRHLNLFSALLIRFIFFYFLHTYIYIASTKPNTKKNSSSRINLSVHVHNIRHKTNFKSKKETHTQKNSLTRIKLSKKKTSKKMKNYL